MIPKIQLDQDFDNIKAAIEQCTNVLIEEHIIKTPPDDWIRLAFQENSKLWEDKEDIKEWLQKKGELSKAESILITDNRIKRIIEKTTRGISKLSKSRQKEFIQRANKIKEVLGFSLFGKACFLHCHKNTLTKIGIEQALRLSDKKKERGVRAVAERWEKVITDELIIKKELQVIKERSKQITITDAVKEINVNRWALFMENIVYEMINLISQEEDCEFDDYLSQEELINIKRANLPEGEKQFIIDHFTKPLEPIRKKRFSQEHINSMRETIPEFELLNKEGKECSSKLEYWRKAAITYYKNHREQFKKILLEDLEDNTLFNELAQLDEGQFIRNFRGKIMQKIFDREGLRSFGIEEINKKIIELKKSK